MDTISFLSMTIGFGGLAFGIYKHFSTKKESKIVYEILQLSNFRIPKEFLKGINVSPVAISIKNSGNKLVH